MSDPTALTHDQASPAVRPLPSPSAGEGALDDSLPWHRVVADRVVIEQATGFIAERLDVRIDEAARVLHQRGRSEPGGVMGLARCVVSGAVPVIPLALSGPEVAEPRTTLRVVCVEDNAANAALVVRVVALLGGVEIFVAPTGEEGLALVRRHDPDVVLLDLDLPDLGGEDVLIDLRSGEATASIPVVVVSADSSPERIDRLRASGAADYLTKPFDIGGLLATIAAAAAFVGDRSGVSADARVEG